MASWICGRCRIENPGTSEECLKCHLLRSTCELAAVKDLRPTRDPHKLAHQVLAMLDGDSDTDTNLSVEDGCRILATRVVALEAKLKLAEEKFEEIIAGPVMRMNSLQPPSKGEIASYAATFSQNTARAALAELRKA